MLTWTPYPFLRILAAFITGLILASNGIPSIHSIENSRILVLILFLVALIVSFSRLSSRSFIVGNLSLIVVGLLAIFRFWSYDEANNPDHLLHFDGHGDTYIASVNSYCVEKEKYFIFETEVEKVLSRDSVFECLGKVQLYIKKGDLKESPLQYGDRIALPYSPFRLPTPKNPHEFNYSEYMAGKNIYFQQFVDAGEVKLIENNPSNLLTAWAFDLRNEFENTIDQNIRGKQENAITKALMLGIRDGLDNDIKKSYSASGAMHVLAVSGLHVGILIVILGFILRPLNRTKYGKYISGLIQLIVLWMFALLAGFSPSILRAVTMFSILIIGKLVSERPNVYNSLALSAFVLLVYNPNFLFSVGFQLSYLAVIGIVYIYPIIYNAWFFNSWLLRKVWAITCVSISAQLATFPLTVYYFHQFPVYFIISNLIVIPAVSVIMITGIGMFALSPTPFGKYFSLCLEYMIKGLNRIVSFIGNLDYSLIDWLYISPWQTVGIYAMLLGFFAFLYYRKFKFVYFISFISILISSSGVVSQYQQSQDKSLTFYEIGGEAVFDKINGLQANLVEISPVQNDELIKFQIGPNRLNNHLSTFDVQNTGRTTQISFSQNLGIFSWEGKKFAILTKAQEQLQFKEKLIADYIIINKNASADWEYLSNNFQFNEIIVDSSNDYYTCYKLEKMAKEKGIKCHILRIDGALTIPA